MSLIDDWAARWNIPAAAVADLVDQLTLQAPDADGKSEAYVQSAVRLEAPYHDAILWRNNVGALKDADGRPVRYGLANDTKEENKVRKSADLVGIRKRLVTPAMVGTVIGQFVSRECKRQDWAWTGDAHEQAQLNWALIITQYGGDAKIVNAPGSFT